MTTVISNDGLVKYYKNFIAHELREQLFTELYDQLAWHEEKIVIYGKAIKVPRLVCWYGDKNAVYRYSGVTHQPLPWLPVLRDLKHAVEARTGEKFNSVLANLYRNGVDSMGWHADKEKELGPEPCIASLSLGAERIFKLRHNKLKGEQFSHDILLKNGSLLVMSGSLQKNWRHSVPKRTGLEQARINLTFRNIVTL